MANQKHGQQQQQETPIAPFGDDRHKFKKISGEGASDCASATTSASVSHLDAVQQQQQAETQMASCRVRTTESTQPDAPSSQPTQQLGKIPRVRAQLRGVASDLFTPQTVLIGPYHHEVGSYFFPSTGLKEKAYRDILLKHKVDSNRLEVLLYKMVDEVMDCYTYLPKETLNKADFSNMLLYDGCYLLSFFTDFYRPTETLAGGGAGSSNGGGDVGGGSGSAADSMILVNDSTLVRDILYLLENQIPLCVLETILQYLATPTGEAPRVEQQYTPQVIYEKVKNRLHRQHYISKDKQRTPATSMPSDLLHLVYSYFRGRLPVMVPAVQEECCHLVFSYFRRCPPVAQETGRWRRAIDYRKYADLQFRRRKFEDHQEWSILDIHLKGGTLYIPLLRVGPDTWTMLRNLMALEEQEEERPVTAYCVFMSQVACTAEDVRLLQGAKILEHFMPSDEEAAKAFAYLCNGVALDIDRLDRNYLKNVWRHLHKRCSLWRYNFKGFFRDTHCSNVFYALVFFVGILVFFSEMAQGFYAAFGYHRPAHS